MRPTPRPLPSETARQLQDLLARHRQLTKMLVEEQNREHQASPLTKPSITAHLAWLKRQREEIDELLASVVASDPAWQARVTQLDTIPGFAAWTATAVAVGLPELGTLTGKQIAALVGVAPLAQESGTKTGRRLGGGRRDLRVALYQAMTSTIRWDPAIKQHYRHLRENGKVHKQAMVACVRRVLGIMNAMARDGLTWQQTQVGQGVFLPAAADIQHGYSRD